MAGPVDLVARAALSAANKWQSKVGDDPWVHLLQSFAEELIALDIRNDRKTDD